MLLSPRIHITRKDILFDLQVVAERLGQNHLRMADYRKSNGALYSISTLKKYGSWKSLLNAAGLVYGINKYGKKSFQAITQNELIEDMKKAAEKFNGRLSTSNYDIYGKFSSGTVIRKFDTWQKALDAAHVTLPVNTGRKGKYLVSREALIEDMKRGFQKMKEQIPDRDFCIEVFCEFLTHSPGTLCRRFGSIEEAGKAAGIIDLQAFKKPAPRIPENAIVDDIKRAAKLVKTSVSSSNYTLAHYAKYGEYPLYILLRKYRTWENAKKYTNNFPTGDR